MWILKEEKGMLCYRAQKRGLSFFLLGRIFCTDSEHVISSSDPPKLLTFVRLKHVYPCRMGKIITLALLGAERIKLDHARELASQN